MRLHLKTSSSPLQIQNTNTQIIEREEKDGERWRKIYATCDNTYKNLKRIINDPNIAVVPVDKELCVVIMNRSDHFKILQHMIDKSIENGVYNVTEDKTFEDLKLFRSFLYRNFK